MSKSLESRLKAIEIRNKKVEDDKAWETSWVRRIVIMALTYSLRDQCILVYEDYLHTRRKYIMAKGKAFGAAVLGAVVGAIAGVLFAPKSGKETREDLKRKADEAKKTAEKKTDAAKKAARESMDEVKEAAARAGKEWDELATDARARAGRVAEDARHTASSVADTAKKHFSDDKKS